MAPTSEPAHACPAGDRSTRGRPDEMPACLVLRGSGVNVAEPVGGAALNAFRRTTLIEATLRSPEDALGAFVLGEAPGKYEGFLTGTPELIPRLPR